MAERKVTVVIDGQESVSTATQQAASAFDTFKAKLVPVIDVTKVAKWTINALRNAFAAAKEFVLDSLRAYDDYAASTQRLSAQSKLTGVSVGDLEKAAKRARDEFGLGVAVANDAAITTAKYAARAGDATRQNELLAAALKLGAASGLTAAESMQALEMGLRGQDEGFDKLLGKNPSTIWKEYADANGLAVGKMTDMQKRMAELTAVIDAGNKVGDLYTERMRSGAGQTEQMSQRLETAKVAFGAAIQPIRILVVQGLTSLINVIGPVVVALGYLASGVTNMVIAPFKLAQSALGSVIEVVGRFTNNKTLEEWGRRNSQAFVEFTDDMAKWLGVAQPATKAVEEHGKAHELAAVQITAAADATVSAGERAKRAADEYFDKASAKLGRPLTALIGTTTSAIDKLAETGKQQLDPLNAEQFAQAMKVLREQADKGNEAIFNLGKNAQSSRADIAGIAGSVLTVARGALDAAAAFKVVDDSTARTLQSVINIATNIAKFAGSGGTDIPSLVSAMSSWVSLTLQMLNSFTGNDPARRKLIQDNTVALDRLRSEMGNLSLNVTGDTFNKVQDALGSVMGQIKAGRGARNEADVFNALKARGLSMNDLKKVADELGIQIRSASGALSVDGLRQLFEAMGLVEIGTFGTDFASQLQATTTGFDVNQTSGLDQIGALGRLGGNFSSALRGVVDVNDLKGTRARLAALFERLRSGGVSAAELGGLTGTQFLDLLTNLIGRIDALATSQANAPVEKSGPDGAQAAGLQAGDTAPSGGIAPDTVQNVVTAMNANLANILNDHGKLHTRVADATEESARRLRSIDDKMDALIAVQAGNVEAMDARLEALRRSARLERGVLPVFT